MQTSLFCTIVFVFVILKKGVRVKFNLDKMMVNLVAGGEVLR